MVFAGQDLIATRGFLDDGVRSVSTRVVECVDLALSIAGEDKFVTCRLEFDPVAGILYSDFVCDQ